MRTFLPLLFASVLSLQPGAAADGAPTGIEGQPIGEEGPRFVQLQVEVPQKDLQNASIYVFRPYPVLEVIEPLQSGVVNEFTVVDDPDTVLVATALNRQSKRLPIVSERQTLVLAPLTGAAPVTLTVRAVEGELLAGTLVCYLVDGPRPVIGSVFANDFGMAQIMVPDVGTLTMWTSNDFYRRQMVNVTLPQDGLSLTLRPENAVVFLSGNVTDEAFRPLSNFTVRVRMELVAGKSFYLMVRSITDASGRFSLPSFPGMVQVSFKHGDIEVLREYYLSKNITDHVVIDLTPESASGARAVGIFASPYDLLSLPIALVLAVVVLRMRKARGGPP